MVEVGVVVGVEVAVGVAVGVAGAVEVGVEVGVVVAVGVAAGGVDGGAVDSAREVDVKRKRSNNPAGRPSRGLTESSQLVRGSARLLGAARDAARREGITVAEWWRRAAAERLARGGA